MRRHLIPPTSEASRDGVKYNHPAYAVIGASRVQSSPPGIALFQSEFRHNSFITITISKADVERHLSRDWVRARGEVIEIAMSEAQWASFVSSMNVGESVPCTLQHINGDDIPGIKSEPLKRSQFSSEVRERMSSIKGQCQELKGMIDDSKLSNSAKTLINRLVSNIQMQVESNIDFVAESFSEHVEAMTEKAKSEINSYVNGVIQKAGIEAITKGGAPFQIESKDGK